MSDKRPTRTEVMKALGFGDTSEAEQWVNGERRRVAMVAMDETARAFGGYAAEPTEVPILKVVYSEDEPLATCKQVCHFDVRLSVDVQRAIAARSNAWEKLCTMLNGAIHDALPEPPHGWLVAMRDLMSSPEMGVGPREQ